MMKEYIEREKVEKMLENVGMISDGEYSGYCTEDVNINNIPSADVRENIQAEWIRKSKKGEGYFFYWYECSSCGAKAPRNQFKHEYFSKFCPDCGAEMKEPEF